MDRRCLANGITGSRVDVLAGLVGLHGSVIRRERSASAARRAPPVAERAPACPTGGGNAHRKCPRFTVRRGSGARGLPPPEHDQLTPQLLEVRLTRTRPALRRGFGAPVRFAMAIGRAWFPALPRGGVPSAEPAVCVSGLPIEPHACASQSGLSAHVKVAFPSSVFVNRETIPLAGVFDGEQTSTHTFNDRRLSERGSTAWSRARAGSGYRRLLTSLVDTHFGQR